MNMTNFDIDGITLDGLEEMMLTIAVTSNIPKDMSTIIPETDEEKNLCKSIEEPSFDEQYEIVKLRTQNSQHWKSYKSQLDEARKEVESAKKSGHTTYVFPHQKHVFVLREPTFSEFEEHAIELEYTELSKLTGKDLVVKRMQDKEKFLQKCMVYPKNTVPRKPLNISTQLYIFLSNICNGQVEVERVKIKG